MQESEREIRQTQKWGRRKEDVAVGVDRGVEEILTDCRFDFSFAHNFFVFVFYFLLFWSMKTALSLYIYVIYITQDLKFSF